MKAYQTAFALAKDAGNLTTTSNYIAEGTSAYTALTAQLVTPGYMPSLPVETYHTNSAYRYYYCNRTSDNSICQGDNDLKSYAIRFRFENIPYTSGSQYSCLTSTGIYQAGTNGASQPNQCVQQ
jgi:hypothetical protein